jgi:hypothetical protein
MTRATTTTPRLETVNYTSARMVLPCVNHPSGELHVVITSNMAKPGGQLPHKRCARCRVSFPGVAFVKFQSLPGRDGYSTVTDRHLCYRCDLPAPFSIHTDDAGRLRMRLKLTDATGAPVRVWDASTRRWRRPSAMGLRRMGKDSNELRLQPYTNRSADKAGTTYARRRELAASPSLF